MVIYLETRKKEKNITRMIRGEGDRKREREHMTKTGSKREVSASEAQL